MFKFLVLSVVLVSQLGISEGKRHGITEYYDAVIPSTDRSTGNKVSYEIPGIGKYEVHHNNATWAEARQICHDQGGNLTVIRSIFDELMVKDVLQSDNVPYVWLGLHEVHDSGEETHWETSTDGDWVDVRRVGAWELNIPEDKTILWGTERQTIQKCGLFSFKVGVIPAPCAFGAPFICENKQ